MDRTVVMDLRREVTRWINRIYPYNLPQSTNSYLHEEVLIQAFQWWSNLINDLSINNIIISKTSKKDESIVNALKWIIRIHIDSLCFGFVSLTNRIVDNNGKIIEENKQIDRAVQTLISIRSICQINHEPQILPLIMNIFGDTCADVARTLNPSSAIKILLETLENVILSENESQKVSNIVQQVLSDIVFAQYKILKKKIELRLDAQYSKAKKYASLQELQELEDKKRNPPIWEYYAELLTYEPEVKYSYSYIHIHIFIYFITLFYKFIL